MTFVSGLRHRKEIAAVTHVEKLAARDKSDLGTKIQIQLPLLDNQKKNLTVSLCDDKIKGIRLCVSPFKEKLHFRR